MAVIEHQEKIVQILKARTIKWKAEPSIWALNDYEIRSFADSSESLIIKAGESMDSLINLFPSDFVYVSNQKDMMTTPELNKFIEKELEKGSGVTKAYEVEKHRRTADPFTTLILSFIGVSIASRKVRGGMGLHLGLGVVIGVIFIFLSKMSLTFATAELMPSILAIWIPNLIFILIGSYLYKNAQQ